MSIADQDARFQVLLGERIRAKRVEAGKILTDAGEVAGVSFSTVSRYELGDSPTPPATLARWAKLYRCKVADFFDGLKI